jgi:Endonuclease NucS
MDDAVRTQIRELLEAGLQTDEIARRAGVSPGTVSAVKAHITMGSYGRSAPVAGSLSETEAEELETAADLKFGLERDMQEALRRNVHQLDPLLRVVDEGRERRVEAGFIDILAEDDRGALVVIELKSGEAPESAVTQVLSYIGSLQAEDEPRPVRGILIARNFPTRVRLAARAAGIQLVEYGFSFTFTVVET